jgi:hypothetical protein
MNSIHSLDQLTELRIRNFPASFKALALGFVCALGLAYVYALGNITLVIGLSPKDIAIHYYGKAAEEAHKAAAAEEGEQEFSLDDSAAAPEAPSKPAPSFKNLVAEGHFHLFGMTSFFFGLTLLGLFTAIPATWKPTAVGLPYLFVILDNLSFMATRFLGPKFAYLTAVSGGLMALSFTVLWLAIVYEVIQKPERKS